MGVKHLPVKHHCFSEGGQVTKTLDGVFFKKTTDPKHLYTWFPQVKLKSPHASLLRDIVLFGNGKKLQVDKEDGCRQVGKIFVV